MIFLQRLTSCQPLSNALSPYEAILLVSFGGPERPEDVMPFLQNVTRGRGIPTERLVEVSQHYMLFGGKSPINDQCRSLLAALTNQLRSRGIGLPLYWGNRNWTPYLSDELRALERDGHRRVLAVVTSAYPSYSSCRQYRENLFDAAQNTQIHIDRIRHYANHPGFVDASVDATLKALEALAEHADEARLVFVTHSIPTAMAQTAGPVPRSPRGAYVDWHNAVAAAVTDRVSEHRGRRYSSDLVYCSRSGPASQPWLEPDVNDHLRQLAASGVPAVVAVPIGFVSDHMEVVFDLDYRGSCDRLRNAALRSPARRAPVTIPHSSTDSSISWSSVPLPPVESNRTKPSLAPGQSAGTTVGLTAVQTCESRVDQPFVKCATESF
jgi:ferrochelatase